MTTIRVNFKTPTSGSSSDPTFNNEFDDSTSGIKTSDLLDIAGDGTGIVFEVLSGFAGESGFSGNATAGSGVFPEDVLDYFWYASATSSIVFSGFPSSATVAVKGIGFNSTQTARDTTWTIDSQSQDYDAGGGAATPNSPVSFTTTQADGSGDLQVDLDIVSVQSYMAGIELEFTPVSVSADSIGNFDSTLNYTTSGLGTITSATLTDLEANVMSLTSVTDTAAVIPDYGNGQRCLTGLVTLTVSDGTDSATTTLSLLPKTGYQSVSLETGFSSNQGDWTYNWTGKQPVVDTEAQWTDNDIILMNDGTVRGVTTPTTLTYYVTDPSDGVMSTNTMTFGGASPAPTTNGLTSPLISPIISNLINTIHGG